MKVNENHKRKKFKKVNEQNAKHRHRESYTYHKCWPIKYKLTKAIKVLMSCHSAWEESRRSSQIGS